QDGEGNRPSGERSRRPAGEGNRPAGNKPRTRRAPRKAAGD
ncbi:ATP-dependent RNA helicase RhlE, partial [Cronobacter sakazakii]